MIVQCPACRALVDVASADVDVEHKRAGLSCSACGAVTWLGAGAAVVEAGEGTAPVAATLVASAPAASSTTATPSAAFAPEASATGGFSAEERAAIEGRVEAIDVVDADELKAGFIALLSQWNDEEAHKKFIQRGMLAGQLAVVGQGYRAVLEERAEDPRAEQGRDRVLAAAMTQLKELPSQRVDTAGSKKVLTFIALIICTGLIVVCGYYIFSVGMPQLSDPEGAYRGEAAVEYEVVPKRVRPGDQGRPGAKRLPTEVR